MPSRVEDWEHGQPRSPDARAGGRREWDHEADLVIVGGSLAGFTTTLHAHELGASVIVLEKAAQVGGTARTVNPYDATIVA